MNEDVFRGALRDAMAATSPPPPMSTTDTLVAGRRARFRRRVVSSCAGTATAVVLVAAVGFMGVVDGGNRHSPAGPKPSSSSTVDPRNGPSQQEWTAAQQRARALLDELVAAVPVGYTVGQGSFEPIVGVATETAGRPATVRDWVYQASFTVRQGEQTGLVLVEVHTGHSPLNQLEGEGCELALQISPHPRGRCQLVTVGEAKVGVARSRWANENPQRSAQWAGYRHLDGTVVKVAQMSRPDSHSQQVAVAPELKKLPFSAEKLAELAASNRFHVN